jgi:hypothetical protein
MKQLMKDYINGGRNIQMEDWKQRLSRPQTLDSLYFASYSKQRQIPSRALLGLRLKLLLIGALMQISLYLMRKQVRLVERLRTQVSQLKEKDLVEKKWLPSIRSRKHITVENKLEDPVQWTTTDWVAAVPDTPKPPADCCSQGMTLRTGISKTTKKPFYGYVCLGNIKEHAIWAQQTTTGAWYFKDKE